MAISYKDAGVDKESGYKEVQLIKEHIKKTHIQGVLSDIGGFSGMFELDTKKYKNPVLVSGTDGVGTKLKLAFMMDKHDTVGIDCVAMCANDIVCQGARPVIFLDYIATDKLIPEKMSDIVKGVSEGCVQAKAALIGGETAEMPGFYSKDEYDLAGFCVGVVDKENIITGKEISQGDILLGLSSSGVHSNGYSLIRKIIFEKMKFSLDQKFDEINSSLGEELLKPTKIYVRTVLALMEKLKIHGISHITGGGFYENIPRMLPDGLCAKIDLSAIEKPKIFELIQKWGEIEEKEMYSTFNMGVGMVIAIDKKDLEIAKETLEKENEKYFVLGEIIKGEEKVLLCRK